MKKLWIITKTEFCFFSFLKDQIAIMATLKNFKDFVVVSRILLAFYIIRAKFIICPFIDDMPRMIQKRVWRDSWIFNSTQKQGPISSPIYSHSCQLKFEQLRLFFMKQTE